ncbi:MAG TPA: CoF synthetase [Planctomycetaceae bacterium]|nr:CoF synthetase [Planctomycetaceae bacterium]
MSLLPAQTGNHFQAFSSFDGWSYDRPRLHEWQLKWLNLQLQEILPGNAFYREKLGTDSLQLDSLADLSAVPITTKVELVESAEASPDGLSRHHTYPATDYSRMHRTSGTTGRPLMLLDSAQDWSWWSGTWQHVLRAAEVTAADRVFLAFSFGPFVGFWSAHQACVDLGATVIPGGGLTSLARLEFLKSSSASVVCCTPSYALHLAEVAASEGISLTELGIRRIIVAGEAGGSVPAVRQRIEAAWGAKVVDHSGATEIGPWGFGWPDRIGLHVTETSFIAELLPIEGSEDDTLKQLVLTSIGRFGAPVIRYATGDAVRANLPSDGPCQFLWLPDGVVGRVDNMVTIRGVNVFPSSIDAIVRQVPEVDEYRVRVFRREHLDELEIYAEADDLICGKVQKLLAVQLGLRINVAHSPAGSLPRSEGKARRWHDERKS